MVYPQLLVIDPAAAVTGDRQRRQESAKRRQPASAEPWGRSVRLYSCCFCYHRVVIEDWRFFANPSCPVSSPTRLTMTRGPCTSTTSTRLSVSTKARSAVTSIKRPPNCALPVGRSGEVVLPGLADQDRQRLVPFRDRPAQRIFGLDARPGLGLQDQAVEERQRRKIPGQDDRHSRRRRRAFPVTCKSVWPSSWYS